ncbi:uncharacterized protein LOC119765034 [Culex quinquefasciatus]|uniref:uncharacterized protein LOC119765034 n=1 Tax=Culex quinquefasciatus TaxID=7176 RepID=UPI0018E3AADA|nr:uncharacterized protein LOC119765034 [Culex quinquefasciatus]
MTRSISSRLRIPKPSSTTILTVPVSSFLLRRKTCGRMSTTPRFGSNDVHQVNLTPPTTTPRISPTGDVRNNPMVSSASNDYGSGYTSEADDTSTNTTSPEHQSGAADASVFKTRICWPRTRS